MNKTLPFLILFFLMSCSEKSTSDHFASAKESINAQTFDTAIIALKNTIKSEPTHAEARYLLGKIYFEQQHYLSAEKELERAFRLKYNANEILPLLVKAYYKSELYLPLVELELDFGKLKLSNETQSDVLLYQLLANIRLGKEEKTGAILKDIKQLDTSSIYKTLALAYEHSINNDNVQALNTLNDVLSKAPKQAEALKLRARLLLANNDINSAIATYQSYVGFYPKDLSISFVLARILMDNNQSDVAEPIIDKLLAINSEHSLLNQLKSLARFNEQDTKQALVFAEKSLTNNPTNLPTRLIAGVSAYSDKDFNKANQHLSFVADQLPTNHPALRVLASSQLALGQSVDANTTMNKFDILTPADNNLISSIGLSLIQQGESEKAKSIINKVSEENISTEALAKLGLLKLSMRDVSGITNLENALEKLLPEKLSDNKRKTKQDVEMVLANAYLATKQYDKAQALADKISKEQPKSIQGEMLSSKINIQLKQFSKAQAAYNSALDKQPNNPEIKLELIKLLLIENDNNKLKAFDEVKALVNTQPTYSPAISLYYLLAKDQGIQQEVIKTVEMTLKNNKNNHALIATLATMYFSEKRYKNTIEILEPLKSFNQKSDVFWPILAKSYIYKNENIKAIDAYKNWLNEAPKNKNALLNNILMLKGQTKFTEAIALTDKLIELEGETLITNGLRAELFLLNNNLTLANQTFNSLPDTIRNLPKAKGLLGKIQFQEKSYTKALANLSVAYTENISPDTSQLIYQCYKKLNQNDKASLFLQNHLKQQPDELWALMELALKQIYTERNEAIITYKKVIKINDNIAVAHNNLAFLIAEQGNLNQAIVHGNMAIKLEPENPDYLDTLGKILLDKQNIPEAVMYLSKAVENTKGETPETIYINYIDALIADNQLLLAKRKFNNYKFSQTNKIKLDQLAKKLNQ